MVSISYAFRLGKTTVSNIKNETSKVLWVVLKSDVFLTQSQDNWLKIAKEFNDRWQLPNCIGAIDGKHIIMQIPPKSGSQYYNYKGSHSIVLMAMCDASYKFIAVDIGASGRQSDGGILRHSELGSRLLNNDLNLPPPSPIEYGADGVSYYVVGEEAFPLGINLMRPYPGRFLTQNKRVFNYRLSRGRRVVEKGFGILASRWRILRKPIIATLDTVESITKATVCLHNWLLSISSTIPGETNNYFPPNLIDREDLDGNLVEGEWCMDSIKNYLNSVNRLSSNTYTKNAAIMRDNLTAFLCVMVLFKSNGISETLYLYAIKCVPS